MNNYRVWEIWMRDKGCVKADNKKSCKSPENIYKPKSLFHRLEFGI